MDEQKKGESEEQIEEKQEIVTLDTTPKEIVIDQDIADEMHESFLAYAMSVIVSRALPDVRDGLKPVHRRILYTLHENGLTPESPYRKCADTVGSVLGRYHPHGDASVYDALVRLAQDFSLRYPLVDGHGNFGSVDGDPPAAYRYTEAKMSKISTEMLTDIQKNTVDYGMNYDDRLKEPEVLPSRFPNLLANGSVGIAVGMATNIPPHNLSELVKAIKLLIDDPDCTIADLMECIKGPDFPTGGIIMGHAGIRATYGTGRGKIIVRAKAEIEEEGKNRSIVITEIPYMVNKADLVEAIARKVKDKSIAGVRFVRDESGRDGMRIVIGLKNDAIPDIVLNTLYKQTQLQSTVGANLLVLDDGVPRVLTLKQILERYLAFQVEVITRRTEFDLEKARRREHLLQGFVLAADHIDEVIHILRHSASVAEGKERLMERFHDVDMSTLLDRAKYDLAGREMEESIGLSEEQAEAIVQMRLGSITGLEREKITTELYQIIERIAGYLSLLGDRQKIYQAIAEELDAIKVKYGDERRTAITNVSGEVDIEELIPEEECVVTYSNGGYLKRRTLDSYKSQRRGGKGILGMKQHEEDFVTELFACSTHDHILFITNLGYMYQLKCYEIPEGSYASKGFHVANLLTLREGEHITFMVKTRHFDSDRYVCMVTKHGKIKRTPLTAYRNVSKHGIIAMKFHEDNVDDEIVGVRLTNGSEELMIATKKGRALRFSETLLRGMGRGTMGNNGMKLRDNDEVVSMARIREGASVLTVTEKGFGRRTPISDYPLRSHYGGQGVINYRPDEKTGDVCGIKVVDEQDDCIAIASDGLVIRTHCSEINIHARTSRGVYVMKPKEGARVVSFTRVPREEEILPENEKILIEEE